MPFTIVVILDICIAGLLLGLLNVVLLDLSSLFLIPPVLGIAVIGVFWLIQKLRSKW